MDILFPQNGAPAGGDLSGAADMRGTDDLFYTREKCGDTAGTCDSGRWAVFPRYDGAESYDLCVGRANLAVLFCGGIDSLPAESAALLEAEQRNKGKDGSDRLHCGGDHRQCVEFGGSADPYVEDL